VADTPAAPIVLLQFNEDTIAQDLTHHPPVARKALDLFRREVDRKRRTVLLTPQAL
jgi:hypothetical protein